LYSTLEEHYALKSALEEEHCVLKSTLEELAHSDDTEIELLNIEESLV
jgi:hypothetical protein